MSEDQFDDEVLEEEEPLPGDNAEGMIQRALDVVSTARTMPLSASVLVDRQEVMDLLQSALERLPDELRQARWLLRERDEFLATRQREADMLLEDVRAQAERMVQRTEIVRQANQVAQRILDDAREEARRLRHEAEDYCDQRLASFEIVLERTLKTVQAGREKLNAVPPPLPDAASCGWERGRPPTHWRRGSSTRTTAECMAAGPFVVHGAKLRRVVGSRWHECRQAPIEDLDCTGSAVPAGAPVVADVTLEAVLGGVSVTGKVMAPWEGACRRCLTPASGELRLAVRELYTEDGDGEDTYALDGDDVDLEPLVRDAVLLELPLAPLCRADCQGLCPECGANRNEEPCCLRPPDGPALGGARRPAKRARRSRRRPLSRPRCRTPRGGAAVPSAPADAGSSDPRRARANVERSAREVSAPWPSPRRRRRRRRVEAVGPRTGSCARRRAACAPSAATPSSRTTSARPAGGTRAGRPSRSTSGRAPVAARGG